MRAWCERLAEWVRTACLLEATAPKAGNVHPQAEFADTRFIDFVRSAEAIAPILADALERPVGRTVFEAVAATRRITASNTNLGIILLLTPLAAVEPQRPLPEGIHSVLAALTQNDAEWTYRAIRLASPGGLGQAKEQDVMTRPTVTLREAMRLAADRDLIAQQYADGFRIVFEFGVPFLRAVDGFARNWSDAIVTLHLQLLSRWPDSLIARKCGIETARKASRLAAEVLAAGGPATVQGRERFIALDRWLRDDGHRRNPGTTADLTAACLFAALRDGHITSPPLPLFTTQAELHASWRQPTSPPSAVVPTTDGHTHPHDRPEPAQRDGSGTAAGPHQSGVLGHPSDRRSAPETPSHGPAGETA